MRGEQSLFEAKAVGETFSIFPTTTPKETTYRFLGRPFRRSNPEGDEKSRGSVGAPYTKVTSKERTRPLRRKRTGGKIR